MQINNPLNKLIIPSQDLIEAVQAPETIKAVQTVTSETAAFYPGKIINASITQRLGPDRLLAMLDGQAYDLYLPKGITEEKSLTLEVISTQPKLLFKLLDESPPQVPKSADNVEWSNDIQVIKSVLSNVLEESKLVAPAVQDEPILKITTSDDNNTSIDTKKAAEILQHAVNKSGYFYESHQALWINNKYPLDGLKQESESILPRNTSEQTPEAISSQNSQQTQTIQDSSPKLVERQLAMIAGSPIEWQGQAWPGQSMYFSIQKDRDANPFIDPVEKGWNTELKLDLPNLGSVDAKLRFSAAGIAITIHSGNASSSDVLRTNSQEFIKTLEALNIRVVSFGVKQDE